jgi:type I restriction enzyme, S subunit
MADMLPKGWAKTTLGELVQPSRDRALPADYPDMRYVGLQHIEPQTMRLLGHGDALDAMSSCIMFSKGDVLYGKMRPYLNKVWLASFDGLCSPEFLVFKCRKDLNSEFLALRLNAEDFVAFANLQISGERPRVDFERLSVFPLQLPPADEQDRIILNLNAKLSALERGERILHRTQGRVKRYRVAVLHTAVTGKLTQHWRDSKQTAPREISTGDELLQQILASRRDVWEKVELKRLRSNQKEPKNENWKSTYREPPAPDTANLPALPERWTWASVQQLGDVKVGRQRSPEHHSGENMRPYLRVANVFEDRIDTSDVMRMNFTPEEFEIYRLEEGDILLNEGQSLELVGRPAMYRNEIPECCFQNTLVRFRSAEQVNNLYALVVFRDYLHSGRFQKIAKITTNLAHLGSERFAQLEVPLPPVAEQSQIVSEVTRRLSAADALEASLQQQLVRSSAVRQTLFRNAFDGSLIPQNPADEPASVLLERIRTARENEARQPKVKHMPKPSTRTKKASRALLEVLRENGEKMTAEQLFRDAGYEQEFKKSKSAQEVVDRFYAELRQLTESPPRIRQKTVGSSSFLELIP